MDIVPESSPSEPLLSAIGEPSPPGRRSLWERALDLVFPPRCVGCGAFGTFICEICLSLAIPALPPRCSVCWMPVPGHPQAGVRAESPHHSQSLTEAGDPEADVCNRCLGSRPAFQAVRSAFVYGGAIRDAVHALKFDGVSALAGPMARSMTRTLLDWSPPVEAVAPVPLSPRRRRRRGYNQSELLARAVARAARLRLETKLLSRRRDTPPQAKQQDEKSRRQNVREAFGPGRARVSGGVLLVDDVVTTGATLDACARALLAAGAGAVFALTYARED